LAIIGANTLSRITSSDTELIQILKLDDNSWKSKIQRMHAQHDKVPQLKHLIKMIENLDQFMLDENLQNIRNRPDENLRIICESLGIEFPSTLTTEDDFAIADYVDECLLFRSNKPTKEQITAQVEKLGLILGY
jgi:hypothetical protein